MNTYQESICQKARAGDCSWTNSNPKTCDTDFYIVTLKFANFPKEMDTSSLTEVNNNLKVTGYANGEQVGIKSYDLNGQYTGTQYNFEFLYVNNPQTPFVNFPLKYTQENNLVICFQINGTQFYHTGENLPVSKLISNEVCLDPVKTNAYC